jgi:predicted methyltransferase
MRLDKDEVEVETDYDKIMSHPQATRYVAKFMQQTGLLQHFRCVELVEDDELQSLTAMDLGVEDDGY